MGMVALQLVAASVVGFSAIGIAWVSGSDHMRIRGESGGLLVCGVVLMLCTVLVAHGWPL